MTKKNEWKKSLENEIEQYNDFLKKTKGINDLVPAVEQRKKDAEAKLLFVVTMPEPFLTEVGDNLFDFQLYDEAELKLHLPGLPSITPETIRFMASGSGSSSDYFEITQMYRHSSAVEPYLYTSAPYDMDPELLMKVETAFSNLAVEKSKKESLPPILNKINNQLGDKFTVAQQNYEKAKNGIVGIDQSAIQLRDVVEQLWGGLVSLVRRKNPRRYNGVTLNLDTKGKAIVVDCLVTDDVDKKKLTLLLETLWTLKGKLSESDFGKNPLTTDINRLNELYSQWILVISDIADFVNLKVELT